MPTFRVLAVLMAAFAGARSVSAQTTVTIPRRIVTLSPNLTEAVFALGCGDKIVGVSDFCDYPGEAKKKQRCGGWANPNFEVLAMLSPDLVVVLGRHEKVAEFCRKRSIAIMQIEMNSIAAIEDALTTLGARLGAVDNARRLCAKIDRDLEALRIDVPDAKRPRVFISLSRQEGSLGTILTTGKGTFVDELVTLAGGRNVFDDVTTPYLQASKEALIARRPGIILEFRPGEKIGAAKAKALRSDWASLASIPAVQNKKIFFLTDESALIAGPRIALAAAEVCRVLKPALPPRSSE